MIGYTLSETLSDDEILFWINEDKDTADFVISVLNDILEINKPWRRRFFGYSTS